MMKLFLVSAIESFLNEESEKSELIFESIQNGTMYEDWVEILESLKASL